MNILQIPRIIVILLICFFVGWIVSSGMIKSDNQMDSQNISQSQPIEQNNKTGNTPKTKVTDVKGSSNSLADRTVAEADTIETVVAPPLVLSARKQINVTVSYDPSYQQIDFPMGDIAINKGVCTDVIVRAYREQGKDLQALVHKDMKQAWSQYPDNWGLKAPDSNIDHRRVPNLRVFFQRHGDSLGVSNKSEDYKAGDMVTWKVGGRPHIGFVSNRATREGVPLIIHNVGSGTKEENVLFRYDITGHYRY